MVLTEKPHWVVPAGTGKGRMHKDTLELILLVKRYAAFKRSEASFLDTKTNWYEETKNYFMFKLPEERFGHLGVKRNIMTFENLLNFKILESMMQAEFDAEGYITYSLDSPEAVTTYDY